LKCCGQVCTLTELFIDLKGFLKRMLRNVLLLPCLIFCAIGDEDPAAASFGNWSACV